MPTKQPSHRGAQQSRHQQEGKTGMPGLPRLNVLSPMRRKQALLNKQGMPSTPSPRVQAALDAAARRKAKKKRQTEAAKLASSSGQGSVLSPKVLDVLRNSAKHKRKAKHRSRNSPRSSSVVALTLSSLSRKREQSGGRNGKAALDRWLQKTLSPAAASRHSTGGERGRGSSSSTASSDGGRASASRQSKGQTSGHSETEGKHKHGGERRKKKKDKKRKDRSKRSSLPAVTARGRPVSAVADMDREPGGIRSSLPSIGMMRTGTAPALNDSADRRGGNTGRLPLPSLSARTREGKLDPRPDRKEAKRRLPSLRL